MKTSTTWIAKNSIKSVLSVIRFGEMKTPDQEKNTKPLDIDSVLSEILYSESSLQDFFDKNHILIIPDSKLNLEFKSQNTKGFFVLSLIDNQKQNLIKSIKEILSAKRIAINNAQITKLVNHFYNYNNSISKNAGADYRVNSSDFVQKNNNKRNFLEFQKNFEKILAEGDFFNKTIQYDFLNSSQYRLNKKNSGTLFSIKIERADLAICYVKFSSITYSSTKNSNENYVPKITNVSNNQNTKKRVILTKKTEKTSNDSINVLPTSYLMNLEHYRANELPYIPETNFTSAKAGSVELFWPEDSAPDENLYQKIKLESELFAKDPWDIVDKDSTVAIDFGTSSTVVMIKDSRGTTIPLRMGGFGRELKARNFENPTVLEFINFKRFMDAWSKEPYKPLTSWNDVKSSFDAKEELHDHASSGITNIKSWAKTKNKMKPTILVDEKNQVFELSPLEIKEENCTDLGDFDQRPLDPIEVYGYYLGLFLNNEALNNGHIYLNYILSYPVKFDKETKKRILQGLRRGIIRSLPPSLIYSKKWKDIGEEEFHVELFVSEPVALAAAALPFLKIEPNESNSFKTVFCIYDFGGGTTDFAVGFFRKATEQEYEDYGKEFIIDILNIHGIENLGGEHLVDCIAYEVLRDNALKLQQNNLTFVMPNDFYAFVGSEKLWHTGEESYGNFAILREAVRPLWERGDQLSNIKTAESINGLHFKNSLGNNVEISLDVDISRIEEIIKEKLQRAINEFFDFIEASIKHYFDERKIEETSEQNNLENINIVLSGNSCKSEIFLDLLNETCEKYRKKYSKGPSNNNKNNSTSENLKISTELIENSKDTVSNELKGKTDVFLRPNLKNSVALGLLKLYTENIEYINHFENENISDEFEQEAPFDFYIGKFENNIFKPCLNRNAKFNAWKEFDKVKKTMRQTDKPRFSIAWTKNSSVERNREEINIDNCQKKSITLKRDYIGYKIYIRPIGPSKIEVGLSETDESTIERILEISLDE